MTLRVKNWERHQHYQDGRRPVWIKLYTELLNDREWHFLAPEAAKLLIELWLLASETDGDLPEAAEIAWRLRVENSAVIYNLGVLKAAGFLVDADPEQEPKSADSGTRGTKSNKDYTQSPKSNEDNRLAETGILHSSRAINADPLVPFCTKTSDPLVPSCTETPDPLVPFARSREESRKEKRRKESGAPKAAPDHLHRLTRIMEEELHWAESEPDLKRDVSVLKSMLSAGIPADRIEAALRGFGVRRRRGEFAKFADRPTMRIFWTKGSWSQFFNECERAWETRAPEAVSIATILESIRA